MATDHTPESNPRRWNEIIDLLSMDVVRPFFDLMGLHADNDLQGVLRHEIINGRKRAALNSKTGLPPPQRVISAVAESLGARTSSHLVWWGRYIFEDAPKDHRNLDKWDSVLYDCRSDPRRWSQLGFPDWIGPDQFRSSSNIDEYQRRQDEIDARPLSNWDLHMYAYCLYDDNIYEDSFGRVQDGPRLWVKPTVRAYQAYRFWARVLKTMGPEQRYRLWQEAHRIAEEEEILIDPSSLPHPSTLEILT